jgi:signal peptidase I
MSTWVPITGFVLALACLGLFRLRKWFVVITVRGASMLPALRTGDRVLVRQGGSGRLHVGMLIVVRSPVGRLAGDRWIIKRVAALPGDVVPMAMRAATRGESPVPTGMLLVSADNPTGSDSRNWGFIDADDLLGSVVRKLGSSGVGHGH